jgi:hypothetical protein
MIAGKTNYVKFINKYTYFCIAFLLISVILYREVSITKDQGGMNKFLITVVSLTVLFICSISLPQDIYVYPNKRLADQGLIEYRRYTLEEARSYQQAGAF